MSLLSQINEAINKIKKGYASQYIHTVLNGKPYTIRIADHRANPARILPNNTISLVLCDSFPKWSPEYSIHINRFSLLDENDMDIESVIKYYLKQGE